MWSIDGWFIPGKNAELCQLYLVRTATLMYIIGYLLLLFLQQRTWFYCVGWRLCHFVYSVLILAALGAIIVIICRPITSVSFPSWSIGSCQSQSQEKVPGHSPSAWAFTWVSFTCTLPPPSPIILSPGLLSVWWSFLKVDPCSEIIDRLILITAMLYFILSYPGSHSIPSFTWRSPLYSTPVSKFPPVARILRNSGHLQYISPVIFLKKAAII